MTDAADGRPASVPTGEAVEAFWSRFVDATGIDGEYQAWAFGSADTPALADKLAQLVRYGPKRATASLHEEYVQADEPVPNPGLLNVILDSVGAPICVVRTTEVTVRRFGEVDADFARAEGEGDLSLEYWRDAHRGFWGGQGHMVDDDTAVVCERFELLWPAGPPR